MESPILRNKETNTNLSNLTNINRPIIREISAIRVQKNINEHESLESNESLIVLNNSRNSCNSCSK